MRWAPAPGLAILSCSELKSELVQQQQRALGRAPAPELAIVSVRFGLAAVWALLLLAVMWLFVLVAV